MSAVVTDTHSLIWYLFEPDRLSEPARDALRIAELEVGIIYVPTICLVEIQYLIDKRIIVQDVFTSLVDSLVSDETAPTPVPLSIEIAARLRKVPRNEVADMPDRVIAATAVYLNLPLVTRDRKILASSVESIW